MKLLLLLGVFFGAAESQEIQKLLAFARQLNQTLSSLANHAAKTRRLQMTVTLPSMPAECPAACQGIQCAYDDLQAIGNQMSGGDTEAVMSAAGDLLGAVCLHRTALTCAGSATQCVPVVETSSLDLAPCICDACSNFPKIYEGMGSLMSAIQGMAGGTPTAEQIDSLLTALCPMSSVLECVDSNSACSSALQHMGDLGSSLDSMAAMKSQCATAGKPTSYATTYSFTPPIECTTTTTMSGSESGGEDSGGADGLLQLNLLAGSFSLFAILK
mmetsp:Transcript_36902/g.58451  ORF Transcript_36902/g.58451 Transcript_36902/m.58451 type:complete len:272 (-) Transcript_36902:212-1027(-)